MSIKEIKAKSLLRKSKRLDSWFLASCGMNIYRGCLHECVYCDGRSEKYYVEGEFGKDISAKINAADLAKKELTPSPRKKPTRNGFVLLGGGVGDSYQPVEKEYMLARKILEVLRDLRLPVHVLTKSALVERDLDIIADIHKAKRAVLSFSFSTVDPDMAAKLEPGCASPADRLRIMRKASNMGIPCGMFFMPVVPFFTDSPAQLESTLRRGKEAGANFVILGSMTLRHGIQKEHFYRTMLDESSDLPIKYDVLYQHNKWGEPAEDYTLDLNRIVAEISIKLGLPLRMPEQIYSDLLNANERAAIMLEHIDYLLRLKGGSSPYGYAAYNISKLDTPLEDMVNKLRSIKGVGKRSETILKEIIRTGSSAYLRKLMANPIS